MSYFSHSWLPYIYQYGLGGLIFLVGMVITLKSGSFDPSHPRHRKWISTLLLGFVWFMVLHGGMTLAALGHEMTAFVGGLAIMSVAGAVTVWWTRRVRRGA